jgi:hypothetical protein
VLQSGSNSNFSLIFTLNTELLTDFLGFYKTQKMVFLVYLYSVSWENIQCSRKKVSANLFIFSMTNAWIGSILKAWKSPTGFPFSYPLVKVFMQFGALMQSQLYMKDMYLSRHAQLYKLGSRSPATSDNNGYFMHIMIIRELYWSRSRVGILPFQKYTCLRWIYWNMNHTWQV